VKWGNTLRAIGIIALVVCAAAVFAQKQKVDLAAELEAMANTERAFARTCGEKGIPASFYEFFSPEGVSFNPHPEKLREAAGNTPPAPVQPQFLLEWEPMFGDVAQSADLGWLAGPTRITDRTLQNRAPRSGFYSSVWKKQPDGTWRVQIDLGIRTPLHEGPLVRNQFTRVPQEKIGKAKGGAGGDSLRQAEKALAEAAATGVSAAYRKWMAPSARMHRNERDPLTTSAAIRDYLATQPQSGAWETLHAETSKADDLGYTYGSYELKKDGATAEKGYYMRVWKRNPQGEWRMVFDVTSPLRPQ
jgi:ketosteroid isomerase-like protein